MPSLPQPSPARSPRPLGLRAGLWRRSGSGGWDQVRDHLSKHNPSQPMGQEGQHRGELSEQAKVTGQPPSIIFQRPWSLWELPEHGENANIACTCHQCPKDVQRSERPCPRPCSLSSHFWVPEGEGDSFTTCLAMKNK